MILPKLLRKQVLVPRRAFCARYHASRLHHAGSQCNFEVLTFVEPHKFRQGSVTVIRKLDVTSQCRPGSIAQEHIALYGSPGSNLLDMQIV